MFREIPEYSRFSRFVASLSLFTGLEHALSLHPVLLMIDHISSTSCR